MNKPRTFAPLIAALLLLATALYMGSYLVLVVPTGIEARVPWDAIDSSGGKVKIRYMVGPTSVPPDYMIEIRHYRWGSRHASRVFWPLEQLDRKLRPAAWRDGLVLPSYAGIMSGR